MLSDVDNVCVDVGIVSCFRCANALEDGSDVDLAARENFSYNLAPPDLTIGVQTTGDIDGCTEFFCCRLKDELSKDAMCCYGFPDCNTSIGIVSSLFYPKGACLFFKGIDVKSNKVIEQFNAFNFVFFFT